MKPFRPILALAVLLPLFTGPGATSSKAQPRHGDPMFDDGPLFDDGEGRGHRPPRGGGPGGRGEREGRGGPGGRGGPRGGGAKGRLNGVWHGIEQLQSGQNALSKAQSQEIVALVKPWSSRPTMSDADAQDLALRVEAVLTDDQKSGFGPPGRGPRGGGGRRGGEFGPPRDEHGPPPPDGRDGPREGRNGGGRGAMAALSSFNPFYAPTGRSDWKTLSSQMQQFLARRYRENRAVLENLSRFSKS